MWGWRMEPSKMPAKPSIAVNSRLPGAAVRTDGPFAFLDIQVDHKTFKEIFGTNSLFAALSMANTLEFGLGKSEKSIRLELAFNEIQAMKPRDATEAMLIHELVMLHGQVARMLAISRQEGLTLDYVFKAMAAARELAKTIQQGIETLARYRSGGKQQVVVSHVNVSPGAQAAVAVGCDIRGGQGDASKQSTP